MQISASLISEVSALIGYLKTGVFEVQHLGPEQVGSAVIQDQFIHNTQRCREVGNLPPDPANSHYREACHQGLLWDSEIIK